MLDGSRSFEQRRQEEFKVQRTGSLGRAANAYVLMDRRYGHNFSEAILKASGLVMDTRQGFRTLGLGFRDFLERANAGKLEPADGFRVGVTVAGSLAAMAVFDSLVNAVNNTRLINAQIRELSQNQ